MNLAETLAAQGDYEEAEAILRRVLEREPNHARAKGALGRALVARGRAAEAIPYLEAATEGAKDPGPLLDLAGAYLPWAMPRRPARPRAARSSGRPAIRGR